MVCEIFEAAGHRTQRTGPGEDPTEGFQFSLGHGVGLEVHEGPSLGQIGREPLVEGDVLAVEPGLGTARSAACASRTCCWSPRTAARRSPTIPTT